MLNVPYKASPLSPAVSPATLFVRPDQVAEPLGDCLRVISLLPRPAELDRPGLLSVLRDLESMTFDDCQAGRLAEFLLTAFADDPLDLGLHTIYAIYRLCQTSACFIRALLELEPIPLFLGQLQSSADAKVVLNLLEILAFFHSIPGGAEICFELNVFSSVSQLFLAHLRADCDKDTGIILHGCCDLFSRIHIETWPDSAISQMCDMFCDILRRRAAFLYWRVAEFVRTFICTQADSGVNRLLDHGFGIELFTQFFDGPLDRFVLRSISSLLTTSTLACKDRLASLIDESIIDVFERAILGAALDPQLAADVVECFEKVGVINTISFGLLNRDDVLTAFECCLANGAFALRYAAARCLFAALTVAGPEVSQGLFSRPIMMDAFDVFEYDDGTWLVEMLRAVEQAVTAMGRPVGLPFWPEFEARFAGVVVALIDCEDETVSIVAGSIAADHFPDLLDGGD